MTIEHISFATPESPRTPVQPRRRLRDATNEQTRRSLDEPTPQKSRKVMNLHDTASLVREEHDCATVNLINTAEKVDTRLFFTLDTLSRVYALKYTTKRGKTHLNGSSAKCQGRCHAGHAALSCKVYDNLFEVVRAALLQQTFSQLDPAYKGYLFQRFPLSESDVQSMNSENQQDRVSTYDRLGTNLTPREKRMTFSGTTAELQRGSTFENPAYSNHFDSTAEPELLILEGQLEEECRSGTKTPIQAIVKFQEGYREFVTTAIQNLTADLDRLDALHEAWNTMIDCQKAVSEEESDEAFKAYVKAAENYLAAHKARFIKPKPRGTASLKSLNWYLKTTQSPTILREVVANSNRLFFELNEHHLKIPTDSEEQFKLCIDEIEGRLTEAHTQLTALNHTETEFKSMLKYGFGKVNEEGEVPTPDKTAIAEAVVDLIPRGSRMKKRDIQSNFIRIV